MHNQRASLHYSSRICCVSKSLGLPSRAGIRVLASADSADGPVSVVRRCARTVLASFAAAAVSLTAIHASASLPASDLSALSYDLNLKKRNQHGAPDRGFEAALELDEDMFVPDAWNAMQRYKNFLGLSLVAFCPHCRLHWDEVNSLLHHARLRKYSKYVDTLEDAEKAPTCARCKDNRKILGETSHRRLMLCSHEALLTQLQTSALHAQVWKALTICNECRARMAGGRNRIL